MRSATARSLCVLVCSSVLVLGLDVSNTASIKSSAQLIAQNIISSYPANSSSSGATLGLFGSGTGWGEAGAVWSGLINYWALTGDSQFNDQINAALTAQSGLPNTLAAFLPSNQTTTEENSDQALWALACLAAASSSLPGNLSGTPYLTAAQNTFFQQSTFWTLDSSVCGGGLRTLINSSSNATLYDTKDTLSAGLFFQLAALLAIQTHNSSYTNWAQSAWTWATSVGLVNTNTWQVYNSLSTVGNCSLSSLDQTQWSAASATFLYGSSLMYNLTNSQSWVNAVQGFLKSMNNTFFQQSGANMLAEPACSSGSCTATQQAYLALTARWVAATGNTAPFATAAIQSLLQLSAQDVAGSCSAQGVCGQSLASELGALDSVDALLLGRPAVSSGSGSSGSSTSASGSSSPSPTKSAAAIAGGVERWLWAMMVIAMGLMMTI